MFYLLTLVYNYVIFASCKSTPLGNIIMNMSSVIQSECNDGRPMYRGIEQHFVDMIVRRELGPGDKLPSINEVAMSAGINKRTVMQAYQRIVGRGLAEVRQGTGTFVVDNSQNNGRRITTIGLVGWREGDISQHSGHHYGQAVYAGIREESLSRNIDCQWINMSTNLIEECKKKELSGCILMGTELASRFLLESLDYGRLKSITISGHDSQKVPLVHGDDVQGMQLLLDHLFSLGHSRIALFYGNPGNYSAQRRLAVYQREMSHKDFDIHPSWICDDSEFTSGSAGMDQLMDMWFKSRRPPTAIIAAGRLSSLATLQMLNSRKIRVPDDVSVCGYDDFPGIQEFATPALTAIRQPVAEIGRTAVRNLIALLGGEQVDHTVLPVELIVRASTAEVNR